MDLLINLGMLILGFVLLIKGADFFVDGSSSIAKRYHVPTIIIGLTIVAMGTSLPETAVSVTASIAGNNSLAVSNAVGSNIFNLVVVIGFCGLMTPVKVKDQTIKRDIPLSVGCAVLLLAFGLFAVGDNRKLTLGHIEGLIMIVIFSVYLFAMIKIALNAKKNSDNVQNDDSSAENTKIRSIPVSILFILGGAAAIAIGGDFTVDAASEIAVSFGMSETLVGLTIVSIGTSLPELVTSVIAAKKDEIDMALGNAVGSNIFNILMVLGIASAINPIVFIQENIIDITILLVFSVIVWIFAITNKKIQKAEPIIMILMYVGYAGYIIARNYM